MHLIPTQVVASVTRQKATPRKVQSVFREIVERAGHVSIAGKAKADPIALTAKHVPKHWIRLFDTDYFLSDVMQIPELRFFVGFVVKRMDSSRPKVFSRIFYKDLSLAWRVASHFTIEEEGELWVGKGDIRDSADGDLIESNEATTDLPLEMQTAVESLLQDSKKPKGSIDVLAQVLRQGPRDRVQPYRDFVAPRAKAQANPKNLINAGRAVAHFRRKNDPSSLQIRRGFEPDFEDGMLEQGRSRSKLYGGELFRYRFLSMNRKIQYYFIAGKRHVWLLPLQSLTTELSTYGVRVIDVTADDDLFLPGYEYHFFESTQDGQRLYSQIPHGFAGDVCEADDAKADASPWLDQIPLIQEFRNRVLGKSKQVRLKK